MIQHPAVLLTATVINPLGQYAISPGNGDYCYAELVFFSYNWL